MSVVPHRHLLAAFYFAIIWLSVVPFASAQARPERLSCPELAPELAAGATAAATAAYEALCWFKADRRGGKVCKKAIGGVSSCIAQAVHWCAEAAFDDAEVAEACFLSYLYSGLLDEALEVSKFLESPSKMIEDCRKALKLISVRVVSDPPGAEISIDGRPYGQAPVEVRLTGKWWNSKIAAVFGSGDDANKVEAVQRDVLKAFLRPDCVMGDLLIAPPGQPKPDSIQAQPEGSVDTNGREEEPADGAAPLQEDSDPSSSSPELIPWIVIGTSGVITVTGAILLGLAASDISTVEDAEDGTRLEDIEGAHDRVPTLSTVGAVLLGVGLAGAVTGVVLLTAADSEPDEGTSISLVPNGIVVQGVL